MHVENGLALSGGICQGTITVIVGLLPDQKPFRIEVDEADANCAVGVGWRPSNDEQGLPVGEMQVSTSLRGPKTYSPYGNNFGLTAEMAYGVCPAPAAAHAHPIEHDPYVLYGPFPYTNGCDAGYTARWLSTDSAYPYIDLTAGVIGVGNPHCKWSLGQNGSGTGSCDHAKRFEETIWVDDVTDLGEVAAGAVGEFQTPLY